MAQALFYFLAFAAVFSALNVVLRRNPVVSTVNLVVVFFCLTGIYILIGFPLVAAIQLLVYAGAILVLFLFVILLLNLKREEQLPNLARLALGPAVSIVLGAMILAFAWPRGAEPLLDSAKTAADSLPLISKELFTTYLIPFEATGALLLAAIVGVILLSRKPR